MTLNTVHFITDASIVYFYWSGSNRRQLKSTC